MDGSYSDLHRYTIRMLFRNPAIGLIDFVENLKEYCRRKEVNEDKYNSYFSEQGLDKLTFEINGQFVEFNCQLRIKKHIMIEEDNKLYWVLVNAEDNGLNTLATKLKPWESLLFKKLVEATAIDRFESEKPNKTVYFPTAKIMKFATDIKGSINHNELTLVLNGLVKEQWLFENTTIKGRFCLGVRAYVELQSILEDFVSEQNMENEEEKEEEE